MPTHPRTHPSSSGGYRKVQNRTNALSIYVAEMAYFFDDSILHMAEGASAIIGKWRLIINDLYKFMERYPSRNPPTQERENTGW
jgi:hypothetical protein